ncbi:toxic anion resistance protein [Beduinella massiliensis]|uniref:toxic anion resistance protein n=1 Tax=Beduinella massiliensis TaxID=1852363 RepID=UPI000C8285D5
MNEPSVPELKLGTENTVPTLTTEPTPQTAPAAQTASAAQTAPAPQTASVPQAAPEDPSLTLEALSAEERKAVLDFVDKIDVEDSRVVLSYGAAAQQQISAFSDKVLENVRTKDTNEVGDMLSKLVAEIKGFDVDDEKKGGLFGWLKKSSSSVVEMKARYDKVEVNVDTIVTALRGHQEQLLKDITMLDEMYALNQKYFRELTLYIVAGEERLKALREQELPPLIAHAKETGDAADAQRANDFAAMIDRFEKKIHDLKLSRMVSIQMGPQVRLMQNNDTILSEKIQSTIVNTIPLWKSQMVIALGMAHAQGALKAQQAVTDVTNDLLKKNAELLKTGTIETAKAAERGIIDIETVRAANVALIDTITEVQRIQTEGANARAQAQQELNRLEKELKDKLLETR